MSSNDPMSSKRSGGTSISNSSSIRLTILMVASELHPATDAGEAMRISSGVSSGKIAAKTLTRRSETLFMDLYRMMELRMTGIELFPGQHEGFRLVVTGHLAEQRANRLVPRRRNQIKPDAVHRELLEEELQTAMLDATSECATAHHPGIDMQRVFTAPARQNGNAAQWTEPVAISNRADKSAFGMRGVQPLGAGVPPPVEIKLIRLVDQLEDAAVKIVHG